jgi:hypothetical protein
MRGKISMEVGPDGTIRTIYADDVPALAQDIGGSFRVARASNVEWEEGLDVGGKTLNGWTVRAAHDRELALRIDFFDKDYPLVVSKDPALPVARFLSREHALEQEVKNFYKLLPPRGEKGSTP